MAEVGTYYITVMPEMSSFTGAVKKAMGNSGTESGKNYSTSFVDVVKGSAIGSALGNLASTAGNAIASGFAGGVQRLDTIENYPRLMQSLGYSAEDAARSIQTISDHLVDLPTRTDEMVRLTQAISDSTGDLDLATKAALGFNDMLISASATSADAANAQGVLNRVLGKGSATVGQWNSLMSVMPKELDIVAQSMLGSSASGWDLYDALEDGSVGWNDFLQAIADLDQSGYIDEFGNQFASTEERARAASGGIGTAIENIGARIERGWAAILKAIGRDEISSAISKASDGVANAMERIAKGIDYVKDKISQTQIGESLGKIFNGIGEAIANIDTEPLKRFADVVIELTDKALSWIANNGETVAGILVTIAGAVAAVAGLQIGAAISAAAMALQTFLGGLTLFSALSTAFLPILGALAAALVYFFTQTELGQAIWQGFCEVMSTLWAGLQQDFSTLVETIAQRMEESAAQWEVFKTNVSNVIEGIKQFFANLKTDHDNMVNQIKQNLADNAVQWQQFKSNVGAVKDGIKQVFENLKTDHSNMVAKIKQNLEDNKVQWQQFKSNLGTVKDGIKQVFDNLKSDHDSMVARIRQNLEDNAVQWDTFKNNVKNAVNDLKNAAINVFKELASGGKLEMNGLFDHVSSIVDKLKGIFNFSWSLPRPKIPQIGVSWRNIGGIVSIPTFYFAGWAANGGVFDTATIIGIGEAGREAALPLNKKTYREIARGITDEAGGSGAAITITGNTFVIREEADINRIARELNRMTRRETGAMA